MRKPFVAGNWKMHGSKASILSLVTGLNAQADQLGNVDVAVCPPAIYIDYVKRSLSSNAISVGAQNVAAEPVQGAFTGEISVEMLKDFACDYVILGHSERRAIYGETDAEVAQKVKVALTANITPILCVGETLEERESGVMESVIASQLDAVLDVVGIDSFADIVIAYEPIWAIGTGVTASPAQAQDVHEFIRGKLAGLNSAIAEKVIIQYGGSVKPDNAKELFGQADIDGGLIGGASLNADDFIAICKAAG
ncbi:triose-phosphate isomerase [Thiomicrorhabdus lithotrophica]|uniref:Triosephosphate isomerase n=1 Tax=Thiomicrorhabdus lithotrophica TaxID=2949997 RepID=A0ABY8C7G3_9GAMM|nr:triose-phosphate isomerase [Thiomicrorhabdus lithotrophica]WEJ61900.1 triose-phosphate isomerase [Thiomicrorhabdus lithotrophica]